MWEFPTWGGEGIRNKVENKSCMFSTVCSNINSNKYTYIGCAASGVEEAAAAAAEGVVR